MTTSLQTDGGLHHDDPCHFATPVRFGRRRTDQVGHLVFTSAWLRFRGTVDFAVAWEMASVRPAALLGLAPPPEIEVRVTERGFSR